MEIYIILTIIGLLTWFYLLSVCKRGQLNFYHFIIGSIGVFIICMAQLSHYQQYVTSMLVYLLKPIGELTGLFTGHPEAGAFFIQNSNIAMSFYIDLECSGIIEMLVFVSLLIFFDVYSWSEKVLVSIFGIVCLIIFNMLRMLLILTIIYYCGHNYYIMAHSVVGRIVFYVLTVILYYTVFTKKQINRQRIGGFTYESGILN